MTRSIIRAALGALVISAAAPLAAACPGDVTLHGAGLDVSGDGMHTLQVVDLDGDGLADLLSAGGLNCIWRNVGGGRLTLLPSFPPLITGGLVRAIDLDGDGVLWLISFGPAVIHEREFVAPFVPGPDHVVASFGTAPGQFLLDADLDGDGLPDVVTNPAVSLTGPPAIMSSLNAGGGVFQAGVVDASISALHFALGDVDLDGRIDVVAISSSALTVALGQGDGTFVPQPPITMSGSPHDIALGHVNGDGLLDVVVAAFGGTQVLVGTGGGGFAPFAQTTEDTLEVALADADGDGDDDVLTLGPGPLGTSVRISLANGSGLSPQPGFTVGSNGRDVAFADFEGDGRPGAVVLDGSSQFEEVTYAPGDGTGSLGLEQTLLATPASEILALADVAGVGHKELVVWQRLAGQVVVHGLSGDGTLGPAGAPTPYAAPPAAEPAVSVLHLDGDNFDDLILRDATGWHPWRSNGDGTFTIGPAVTVTGMQSSPHFATGDLDGDGNDDLLVATSAPVWFRSQGDGTLGAPQGVSVPGLSLMPAPRLVLADADGDGRADLFCGASKSSGNGLRWWKGAGDGSFGPPASLTSGTISTLATVVADVDGDGDLDVVAFGQGPSEPPDDPAALQAWLTVVHGHADGSFDAPREFRAGALSSDNVVLADLDLDGRLDAIVEISQAHRLLLRQAADGTFAEPRILPVVLDQAGQSLPFVTADLDGDGDQDFVFNTQFDAANGAQEIRASFVDRNDEFLDLGHASVGPVGRPVLSGAGRLMLGKPARLQLAAAPANAPTLLLLGLQTEYLAASGSLLVPSPQVALPAGASSADGTLALTGRWPVDAPPGLAVYVQCWSLDPATGAVVASNGLQLVGN